MFLSMPCFLAFLAALATPAFAQDEGAQVPPPAAESDPPSGIFRRTRALYEETCGEFAGIQPFVAVASVRQYDRGAASDADGDGTPDDDRNGDPALSLGAFAGGGVTLSGCVPLINGNQYDRSGGTKGARGAIRIGPSLAVEGGTSQGEASFHLPLGFTAYFHPRPQGGSTAPAATLGITAGYDIVGWTPDLATNFVGDTRATGLLQQLIENDFAAVNESWVVYINIGLTLPAKTSTESSNGAAASRRAASVQTPAPATEAAPAPSQDATPRP